MTTISLEANVKSLVTSAGLSLASSGNTVTLSLNNSGLAQILSQILQSSSTVTVNYNASTGTISFTSTGGGSGGGGGGIPPLVITNKNQFNSNNEIFVELNQDVFLLATNTADWDPVTYTLQFPYNVSEPSKHFLFVRYDLPSNSNVDFSTALSAIYNLRDYSNEVVMVVITPGSSGAIYGSMQYLSP
jgi:hypothetical protein